MPVKIVVGYDFSGPSNIALNAALHHAALQPGSLMHVIIALEESHGSLFPGIAIDYQGAGEMQERLSDLVQTRVRAVRPEGLHFFVHARIGNPSDEILALAAEADADMICVGTHGHSGLKRWLVGSVAERVMRDAHCPVLIARSKDYEQIAETKPEPPCPRCVEQRQQSGGATWWCVVHAKPYVPPHRYTYHQHIAELQPDDQPLW